MSLLLAICHPEAVQDHSCGGSPAAKLPHAMVCVAIGAAA